MFKLLLFCVTIISLNFSLSAQKSIATNVSAPKVIYNEGGVKISTKEVNCINKLKNESINNLVLIVENQNNTPVNLKIKHQLYYDGNCVTCDNEEYNFKYQLDAKEKVEGACDAASNPEFVIFHHMNHGYIEQVLTDAQFQVVQL